VLSDCLICTQRPRAPGQEGSEAAVVGDGQESMAKGVRSASAGKAVYTAFELLLFSAMQDFEFSGRGVGAIARRGNEVAKMFFELDFRMITIEDLT
jgi:hypothetical protein